MDSLLKIQAVKSSQELDKLRVMCDQTEGIVRSLDSMSIGAEMYGTILTPVVLTKIPEDFRVMLNRKLDEDTWDLSAVIKVFNEELSLREKCSLLPFAITRSSESVGSMWPKSQSDLHHFLCLLFIQGTGKARLTKYIVVSVKVIMRQKTVWP